MAFEWFRLSHDLPVDRKLISFSPAQRWAWVCLLCAASQNSGRGNVMDDQDDMAIYCGFSNIQDYQFFLDKLRQKGMIEPINGGFKIVNWEKRQYVENPYGRLPTHEWRILRELVFARDNYTCQYCGVYGISLQCDHVNPLSRGGSNDLINLATACKKCNLSKHNKTAEEWKGIKS